jgi:hypothetical protein
MATKTELATKVLRKLMVISAVQSGNSNDLQIVEDAYDSVYEELRSRHLVDWGSGEDIPTWAVLHVRDIVSNRVANDFERPRSMDEESVSFIQMAKHLAVDYAYAPVKADFS